MLQFVVHLEHLVMSVVHVDTETVQHLVLLSHLCVEVLIFIFDVRNYASKLIKGNVLVVNHFPLLLEKLLGALVFSVAKFSILISRSCLKVKKVCILLNSKRILNFT